MPFDTVLESEGVVTDAGYPGEAYLSKPGLWLITLNLYYWADGIGDVVLEFLMALQWDDISGMNIVPPNEYGWLSASALVHITTPKSVNVVGTLSYASNVNVVVDSGLTSLAVARVGPLRWTS